jgi:hypothetical protein
MNFTLADLGVVFALVSAIVGAGTAYLRLFTAQQLGQLQVDLMKSIRAEFLPREVWDSRLDDIVNRLGRLESIVHDLDKRERQQEQRR